MIELVERNISELLHISTILWVERSTSHIPSIGCNPLAQATNARLAAYEAGDNVIRYHESTYQSAAFCPDY